MSAQSQQPVRGSYWRDPGGLWRYLIGGQPVPGARDVTAEERYLPCPRVDRGGRRWVLLEPDWVSGPRARPELGGLAGGLLRDAGGLMAAEDAVLADPGVVVDLYAPELALDALIGMADIAASIGAEQATVRSWLRRGVLPAPAGWVGPRVIPLWARPPIRLWVAARSAPAAPHRR